MSVAGSYTQLISVLGPRHIYYYYFSSVGSVYSVAAVLLTFLRSLEDPVVPRSVHQRCMDASNNPTLCRQVDSRDCGQYIVPTCTCVIHVQ